jgi:hypothetical protein
MVTWSRAQRFTIGLMMSAVLHFVGWQFLSRNAWNPAEYRQEADAKHAFVVEFRLYSLPLKANDTNANGRPNQSGKRSARRATPPLAQAANDAASLALSIHGSESDTNLLKQESVSNLDIEALKASARKDDRENRQHPSAQLAPALSSTDKLGEQIAGAARSRCGEDYTPTIGPISFRGLMKLPFLINGAMTESGCKW